MVKKNDTKYCAICGKKYQEKKRFTSHHLIYNPPVTVLLCFPCDSWVHGRMVYSHPFLPRLPKGKKKKDLTPQELAEYKDKMALGVYKFHKIYSDLYEKKVLIPAAVKDILIVQRGKSDITH